MEAPHRLLLAVVFSLFAGGRGSAALLASENFDGQNDPATSAGAEFVRGGTIDAFEGSPSRAVGATAGAGGRPVARGRPR